MIVDTHTHFWEISQSFFLAPTLEQGRAFGMGDISGMLRDYVPHDYRVDTRRHGVEKIVWVTATNAPAGVCEEVAWADRLGREAAEVAAIVGSVDPRLAAHQQQAELRRQASSPLFRGVRILHGLDFASGAADEYMRMLASSGLSFDLVAPAESMLSAAAMAERHPDVPMVLEHCGWPQRAR